MDCPATEGVFLPCSFWLADCWYLLGRKKEARELFERLLDVRNDLGPAIRRIRSARKASAGKFSSGLLARRIGKLAPEFWAMKTSFLAPS